MPLNFLPSSPTKICRGRRASTDANTTVGKSRRNSKGSRGRNLDEELLQHIREARRPGGYGGLLPPGASPAGREGGSPSLPYSKDFGSFDLTLCLAADGRCVVLVEYERRVFVNGRQIYVHGDGRVSDRLGKQTAKFQEYYDGAIAAKKLLRGIGSRHWGRSSVEPPKGNANRDGESPGAEGEETERNPGQVVGGTGHPETLERNYRITFESELTELEAAFGRIIARLCKLIFDVIGHEASDSESTVSEDGALQSERLQTTLGRLSDQFQSVIELSSSLRAQHESAEAVQDMWMVDGLTSGGDTGSRLETETINSGEPGDQRGNPPHPSQFLPKPHALWEENQTLRKDVRSLEIELQQLEALHKKVEDQFFEVESVRVDAQNQLAATTVENESLKKQLARLKAGTEGNCGPEGSSEGSASNLLSRFAKRLSGNVRNTSPAKSASATNCSSSNEDIIVKHKVDSTISIEKKDEDVLERFRSLDRHHNLRSEMKRLREVYKNMEEEMEGLGEENRSLRMRVLKMEREKKDMKGKIRDADGLVEDRNREIEHLDSVNAKLDARCSLLASEKAALEAEVVRINARLAETGSRLRTVERELVELEKAHKGTEVEKRHCRDRLDVLNQAHLEECNKTSKLLKEKASTEGQLSKLRREHGEVSAELEKIRIEHDANAAGRLRAEKDISRLELELRAADESRVDLTDEVHHLRRDLDKSEINCKTLEVECATIRDKCTRKDAEAGEMRSRSEELYLGNRMLEEENSCLKDMNRQLQRENSEMQETVSSLTDSNAGIRAKMRQWNRDNISMEKKMKKLVHAKAELHGVIKQLNTVHSDIENRFEKLDNVYSDLEDRLLTKGGKTLSSTGDEVKESASFEEDFQRECALLKKQLHDQGQPGSSLMTKELLPGHRSKGEDRQRRSSFGVTANLRNDFAELEKEMLGRGGTKTQQKRSPQIANDVTFVSACSDLDEGGVGLWWDESAEMNNSPISGAESINDKI